VGGANADAQEEVLRGLGLGDEDLAAWREAGLPEEEFGDWLTDRVARRPAGSRAREVYGADDVHDFARRAILEALALGPDDHLLDVGCGGGLLLRDALVTGASATGLDHSQDMVELARERAPGAEVVLGSAERLPFADHSFSALAMSIVFFFLGNAYDVLRECRRVCCGLTAAWRSTPRHRSCAEPRQRQSRSRATAISTPTTSSASSPSVRGGAALPFATTEAASC
jgi:SAM-dependent methyltransferase